MLEYSITNDIDVVKFNNVVPYPEQNYILNL